MTRQGTLIADLLDEVVEFQTAQAIHAELRRRGHRVGLTTVYRHLGLLADGGVVDALRTPSGETVYRRCPVEAHHHHLICRACGKTVEFEGPEVERRIATVARAARFEDVSHTVEVFGKCGSCAGRERGGRARGSERGRARPLRG